MEHWKSILAYYGIYEVSDLGNIRSLDRFVPYAGGSDRWRTGKVLSKTKDGKGYNQVSLSMYGKQKKMPIARAVLEAFVGPRPDVAKYVKYYKKHFPEYYNLKPGITSYSSIYFANESELYVGKSDTEKIYIEETIPKKAELDKKYYYEKSLWTDIKLIF